MLYTGGTASHRYICRFGIVIIYAAQGFRRYLIYKSTQNNAEKCFLLIPNSEELKGYLEKIKPVNYPNLGH